MLPYKQSRQRPVGVRRGDAVAIGRGENGRARRALPEFRIAGDLIRKSHVRRNESIERQLERVGKREQLLDVETDVIVFDL